jgi:hypothetical protein
MKRTVKFKEWEVPMVERKITTQTYDDETGRLIETEETIRVPDYKWRPPEDTEEEGGPPSKPPA